MSNIQSQSAEKPQFYLEEDHHPEGSTNLGFWLYLMSDCLIFATLFATYAVLGRNYAAGPAPADLFDLKLVAINTAMLLFSSITYGFAMLQMERGAKQETLFWLAVTGLFGLAFLGIELYEFHHMIHEGATPQRSAFLSAFFFLHMNLKSEGGWNMLALIFTIVVVVIAVAGSVWVMYHLNVNMMPTHDMQTMG